MLYFGTAHAVVYDHNDADITGLTLSEINKAKSDLHIAYGHTSHGSQITTGMTGLVGFANNGGLGLSHPTNTFAWNNGGTGGALDLHDYAMGGDVGYYPDWVNNTINYLGASDPVTGMGTNNSDVNVIMWSWCGQVDTTDLLNNYFNPMAALEEEYFGVTFVYMTGHLEGGGIGSSVNLANEQIRDFAIANDKVLYDFADIESYDPDGLINYMELLANDACYYDSDGNGTLESNWAINWQNTHTEGVDWYSCSSAHSQDLNANLKAYAAWNMFVDIAELKYPATEVPAPSSIILLAVGLLGLCLTEKRRLGFFKSIEGC